MQIIPYLKDNSAAAAARHFYAPHHFRSSRSYTLDPGQSVLITLDQHEKLDHVVSKVMCCGNKSVACRYANPEKLGILVTNTPNGLLANPPPAGGGGAAAAAAASSVVIFVPINTYLNVLLSFKTIKSQFVTIPDIITTEKRKEKKSPGCYCHLTPPPPTLPSSSSSSSEDSCTDECDHANIDDHFYVDAKDDEITLD